VVSQTGGPTTEQTQGFYDIDAWSIYILIGMESNISKNELITRMQAKLDSKYIGRCGRFPSQS